jgi:D-lactate dehydrogenase
MKIVVFRSDEAARAAFADLARAHEVVHRADDLTPATAAAVADAEAIVPFAAWRLDAALLGPLERLRLIALRSAGYDHVDLGYCRAHGITVCNAPGYGDASVAEHAFALLLALAKHLVANAEQTRRGRFADRPPPGIELAGRTLGVVGTGRIGLHAAAIGRGFGMRLLGFDRAPDPTAAAGLGLRHVELPALLAESDVVTLHVPGTPQTRGMIGAREFGLMKRGAILINTARGTVVDTAALLAALDSGRLGGAGLDVLPDEPVLYQEDRLLASARLPEADLRQVALDHALLKFPNVLVTSHNAYNTREAIARGLAIAAHNIEAFLAGRPEHQVT